MGMEAGAEVRAAITELLAGQDAAWNAGDAAAFGASCAASIVFTNVVGMFSVGLAPFVAQHEFIFSTIYRGSTLRQELVHLTMVRPDVAIVDTLSRVTGFGELPPGAQAIDGALRTRIEQVMTLEAGRWVVASFHNVPVNPMAERVKAPE